MDRGSDRRSQLFFGPLSETVCEAGVTDVAVTCDGRVWSDVGLGMRERPVLPVFQSPHVLRDYAVRLCSQLGYRLDDACPIADAVTPQGVRVHAVIAPLVPRGAAISIRFPAAAQTGLDELAGRGMFPPPWRRALGALVAHRASILITGATGTGKTTLLKALLAACDTNDRVVTVEEVRELGEISLPDHVSLAVREANVEGAGAVGLSELVRATLRMRPDRVVLGECRGRELSDVLRAFNAGHRGGMVTLHATDVAAVPVRLATLGMLAGLNPTVVGRLVHGAFDVVLHLERSGGMRRIGQIGTLSIDRSGRLVGVALATWDGLGPVIVDPAWPRFARRWGMEEGDR